MNKNEYSNMYQLENSYWWYLVLHHLVELHVQKKAIGKKINIMDAGCGTGRLIEILQKYGHTDGLDFSEDAIHFATERGITTVKLIDLNNWESDKKYDLIVSLDVLYHAGIKDDLAIIKKFYEALESGGTLVLNLPAFEILKRPHDIVVHTQRRYTKSTLTRDIEKSGFKIETASYRMPHIFFIILISKLIRNKGKDGEAKSDLYKIPTWLNKLLIIIGKVENKWLFKGGTIPVGSSLFIVAKK